MTHEHEKLVEIVAWEICKGRNGANCLPWARLPASHKAPYLTDARAAISAIYVAMKDPTPEMCNAAIDTHPFELGDISPIGLRMSPQSMFAAAFSAMLAASPLNGGRDE
jgi:hypothetical protein